MKRLILLFILILGGLVFANDKTVHILFNSDSHGTLYPCSCPKNPAGGLSRRATLIDSLRIKFDDLLVLEGGDFSGGGKYDLHSEGFRNVDSVRTIAILKSLSVMGYDAINIGDEDLNYGINFLKDYKKRYNLPFVSLNIVDSLNSPIFSPYVIKKIDGKKILITGIVFNTKSNKKNYKILAPIGEVKKLLKKEKFDYALILNHCGQDSISKLVDVLNSLNLTKKAMIFNAHYKKALGYKSRQGGVQTITFNYTSKFIHYIDLDIKQDSIVNFKLVNLGLKIGYDNRVQKILKWFDEHRKTVLIGQYSKPNLELFIMAHCPYCPDAIKGLLTVLDGRENQFNWSIFYIYKQNGDNIESMHGKEEADEDILQITLQLYDKSKFLKFLKLRYVDNIQSISQILKKIGVSKKDLEKVSKKEINNFLYRNSALLKKYGVNASPTLLINGKNLNREIVSESVAKKLCEYKDYDFCKDVPECIDDRDCSMPGKIGKCLNPKTRVSKCVYRDDAKFNFYVIYDSLSFYKYDSNIVSTTKEVFPNVVIKYVNYGSSLGKNLLSKYKNIKKLPFYVAESNIEKAERFVAVKNSFLKTENGYILNNIDGMQPILLDREYKKGNLEFYFAPMGNFDKNILSMVLDLYVSKKFNNIGFIFIDGDDVLSKLNSDQILKMEYLKNKGKLVQYLRKYLSNGPTVFSDNFNVTKEDCNGISVDKYKKLFKNSKIKSPMYILLNNNELLPIGSEEDFFRIISFYDKEK